MEDRLSLQFEPNAMIRLFGVQLYDTPMAMLRENVQNAYDAIRMRQKNDSRFSPAIHIEIDGSTIAIRDNGIGMNAQNIKENYWTAGNSGKNTTEAQAAGVVGHFGIGALANFGICSVLEVSTMLYGTHTRYVSRAEKAKLAGENITLTDSVDESDNYGTTVTVTVEPDKLITVQQARDYLKKYVEFIPVPVYVNNLQILQSHVSLRDVKPNDVYIERRYQSADISFTYSFIFGSKQQPINAQIKVTQLEYYGNKLNGELFLSDNRNGILGLNNGFGLANVSVTSQFEFGGIADFTFLQPTAGREAVSRESAQTLQTILGRVESLWAEAISEHDIADKYRQYLQYVYTHFTPKLSSKIKIMSDMSDVDNIELGQILANQGYVYFNGNDPKILKSLLSSDKRILRLSPDTLRRRVQIKYLNHLGIPQMVDKVMVTQRYEEDDLDFKEYITLSEIKKVIEDDYIIKNFTVVFAELTLGVTVFVEGTGPDKPFTIYIQRGCGDILNLMNTYKSDYLLFTPLVKDYVRTALYRQFVDYIPKDQKQRANSINEAYMRDREELVLESEDSGNLEFLYEKLRENKVSVDEFMNIVRNSRVEKQEQSIDEGQVGSVENVVKTITMMNTTNQETQSGQNEDVKNEDKEAYIPFPPIVELSVSNVKKLLKTDLVSPVLNGHRMFLALSTNMNRDNRSFFFQAHTTKVLWSMHRIYYIFTDKSAKVSLYYEMELTEKLDDKLTDGKALPSATIVTKNKVYVPIPEQLYDYFRLTDNRTLKFYVHFVKVKEKI